MTREIIQNNESQERGGNPHLVTDFVVIQKYLPLLAQEFAPDNLQGFSEKLCKALQTSGLAVFADPNSHPRGADMLVIEEHGCVKAVSVAKYYSWNLLKEQLCLQPIIAEGEGVVAFRVRSMESLFADAGTDLSRCKVAAELAYNYVDPQTRRKGYGEAMFAARIQRAIKLKGADDCALFTILRSAHIVAGTGKKILNELMRREREIQGATEQQRITPQGINVAIYDLVGALAIPPETDFAEVHQSSRSIAKFAVANQMQFVGFFRDLSPVFAKVI